jgi:hypothetical protein
MACTDSFVLVQPKLLGVVLPEWVVVGQGVGDVSQFEGSEWVEGLGLGGVGVGPRPRGGTLLYFLWSSILIVIVTPMEKVWIPGVNTDRKGISQIPDQWGLEKTTPEAHRLAPCGCQI